VEEPGYDLLSGGGGKDEGAKDSNQLRRPLTDFMPGRIQGVTSVVLFHQVVRVYILGGFPRIVR